MTDTHKYISYISSVLILAVFTIPFLVGTSFYFPFITFRNFAFRILIGLLFAGVLYLYFNRSSTGISFKHPILISLAAFVLTLTISSIINGDFLYSFWSTYERMEGLLNIYYVILFIIVILFTLRKHGQWLAVFRFTLFASFLIGFIALAQNVGISLLIESAGGDRVSGTLGNATYLATYALFHIYFGLFLLFKKLQNLDFEFKLFAVLDGILILTSFSTDVLKIIVSEPLLLISFILPQIAVVVSRFSTSEIVKQKSIPIYFLLISLINLFAVYNTQTRGAMVGFLMSLFFMTLLAVFIFKAKKIKKVFLTLLIGLIIMGGLFYSNKDASFIQDIPTLSRIANISFDDTTTQTRLLTWQAAYEGWKEKPILGWGEEKFYVVFNKYFPEKIYRHVGSRIWFDRPHNIFLQPLVQGGIVGFIAYLAIFFFAYMSLWKYRKETSDNATVIVFIGLLTAYLIQNAFVFDSINSYILLTLLLGYVVFLTARTDESSKLEQKTKANTIPAFVSVVSVLALTYALNVPYIKANINSVDALRNFNIAIERNDGVVDTAQDLVDEYSKTYLGKYEFRQTFSEQVSAIIERKQLSDDVSLELGKLAEEELLKSIVEQSDNVRHYAFLTNLYLNMSRLDRQYVSKNIELLETAIPLSPTRTHLYYSRGRSYVNAQNQAEAIASFRKAVELSPKVFDAHLNLIAAFLTFDLLGDAHIHIISMPDSLGRDLTASEISRIAEVYQLTGHVPEALALVQNALIAFPTNPLLLRQAAVYYATTGDKESAREAADRVLEADPSFENEYFEFIEQLQGL